MEATGLRKSDPRLKEMVKNLEDFQAKMVAQSNKTNNINDIVIGNWYLKTQNRKSVKNANYLTYFCSITGRSEFKELIYENIVLISKALRHQFIIPDFLGFTKRLDEFYNNASKFNEGKVADYIMSSITIE